MKLPALNAPVKYTTFTYGSVPHIDPAGVAVTHDRKICPNSYPIIRNA